MIFIIILVCIVLSFIITITLYLDSKQEKIKDISDLTDDVDTIFDNSIKDDSEVI